MNKKKSIKVCLIFARFKYPCGHAPLGISYIASYLREKTNNKITLIDTSFMKAPIEKVTEILEREQFDLIGFSVMVTTVKDSIKLAKIAKKVSNPKIVFGGPQPTVLPNETLAINEVDAISIGESEETWLELVKKQGNFKDIKGLWYKKGKKIVKNYPRPFIENLDKLPFPAWDLLDMRSYIDSWFELDLISPNIRGTAIIATRGCPYHCSYCQPTLEMLFGKKFRKRSPKNIVKEMIELKKRYNLEGLQFMDDTFVIDKEWVKEICNLLIEKNVNVMWSCNIRADLANEEQLKLMKKSGCVMINIGIESGSQRVLDEIYNKGITLEDVKNAVAIGKRVGLKCFGFFMLGAPTETVKEINQTISFATKLDLDEATFNITTPLPGTNLFNKTKHLIAKDINDFDYYGVYSFKKSAGFTQKQIRLLQYKAFICFYFAPKRIIPTIKPFFSINGFKKMMMKFKRLGL